MKKFLIVLGISLTVLTVSSVNSSLAGDCCQNHCYQKRTMSNRIFSIDQYSHLRRLWREDRIRKNQGNHYSFWRNYNRQINRQYDKKLYKLYRASHSDLFPRNNNLYPTHKRSVRETNYHQDFRWDTYRKNRLAPKFRRTLKTKNYQGFSVKVPESFVQESENVYYNSRHGLKVKVSLGFTNCNGVNFNWCVPNEAGKSRENLGEVANLTHKTSKLVRTRQNDEKVYYPLYQESFVVNEDGGEKVYFLYVLMNPLTQKTVRLQGVTPLENKVPSENLMKTILFNTSL